MTPTPKGYKRSEDSVNKQINTITGRKRPLFSKEWKDNIAKALRGKQ